MAYVWVAVGGVIGCLLRFGLQVGFMKVWPHLPIGTFLANAVGCFVIGLAGPLALQMPEAMRLWLITGLLGSLTTLSSLQFEVFYFLEKGKLLIAGLHWVGGALLGIGFVMIGSYFSQKVGAIFFE